MLSDFLCVRFCLEGSFIEYITEVFIDFCRICLWLARHNCYVYLRTCVCVRTYGCVDAIA